MDLSLTLFGRQIELRTKALQLQSLSGRGGWWNVIRESYTGAWQSNVEVRAENVLAYSAVFACVTLIASDIAKLGLWLVEEDSHGMWSRTESAAFSPVLRKPNRYSTRIKFIEQWMTSKLIHGNTYVLKSRDQRGVVNALYVLDPSRVTPLVSTDGSVYYEIRRDDLSNQPADTITVPAREIIHDTCVALYHPLVGVSPIYACGTAALQGLSIQTNSHKFFSNSSQPGAIITAPAGITDVQAAALKAKWEGEFGGDNFGKIAIIGGELKFNQLSTNAVDAQLIEQLKWTAETVCSCFHIQPYMISVGPPPPYANVEPLTIQYYSQCLQSHIENLELVLDEGLELPTSPRRLGTEFDLDDLMRMDTASKTTAAQTAISSGGMSPDEARRRYFDLGPVKGGNTPYMQAQMYALSALAERDADQPFSKPVPMRLPDEPPDDADEDDAEQMAASFGAALRQKALAMGLVA